MGVPGNDPITQLNLPPGFRFHPTDEELLVQYLCKKVVGYHFSLQIIADIDLYKFDPWVLPDKAMFGEKEWYFFSPRDRKYPNGSRPNRVAGSGYWKATGTDKLITSQGSKVGIKKALVFYIGKAPKGTKTNWIMHEYRVSDPARKSGTSKLDDWVLCRIYKKSTSAENSSMASKEQLSTGVTSSSTTSSPLVDVMESLPEIEEQKPGLQSWFGSGNFNWSVLAGLSSGPETGYVGRAQGQHVSGHVINDGGDRDVCVPCVPPLRHVEQRQLRVGNRFEEEVQSGLRNQRVGVGSEVFCYPGPSGMNQMMGQSYSNLGDPFGVRYTGLNPMERFGFRQ